jgi:hypothetical protein
MKRTIHEIIDLEAIFNRSLTMTVGAATTVVRFYFQSSMFELEISTFDSR